MSAIGPGDWVECVDVSPRRIDDAAHAHRNRQRLSRLALGAIYQVASVQLDCDGDPSVQLVGISIVVDGRSAPGYSASRFRPIYRPKADFLESLLTPADAPSEREGVDA